MWIVTALVSHCLLPYQIGGNALSRTLTRGDFKVFSHIPNHLTLKKSSEKDVSSHLNHKNLWIAGKGNNACRIIAINKAIKYTTVCRNKNTLPYLLCCLAFLISYVQLFSSPNIAFASSLEAEALLKWKASFQNQTKNNLTSWAYYPKVNTIPCNVWTGISCNTAASVNRINLTNSGIQGTLYEFPFLSLPNLEYIDLSFNQLFGAIPSQISSLSKLIYFDLSYNQLSGKIPPEIGLLNNLQALHLSENQLNCSIPQEIGQLKFLNELALHNNGLHGSIPASLGNLSNLEVLYMHKNYLTGTIPPSFGNLKQLINIYLYTNQLSGSLPSEIGYLKSLVELCIEDNNLSGPIPSSLGDLTNLTRLYLFQNNLSGTIPKEIGNLKSTVELELSQNQLNGSIPTSLGDLSCNIPIQNKRNSELINFKIYEFTILPSE